MNFSDIMKKGLEIGENAIISKLKQLSNEELQEILYSDKSEKLKELARKELDRRNNSWF